MILSPVEQSIKRKIEAIGTPLKDWDISINYGIKTGANDAFIIDGAKRNELISSDPKSAEIIRPILRGRDIKRYGFDFADCWVILAKYGSYKYLESTYPAVYEHLCKYKEKLKNRGQCRYTSSGKVNSGKDFPGQHHWLELDNNPCQEYLDDFSKQKIVWGEISDKPKFALDTCGEYTISNTAFMLTGDHLEYLVAILNSEYSQYCFSRISTTTGEGTVRWLKYKIETLPIPPLNRIAEKTILNYLSGLEIEQTVNDSINQIIYNMFNFTDEEIRYMRLNAEPCKCQ